MDKYTVFANKLHNALQIIDRLQPRKESSKDFIIKFRKYIEVAKDKAINREISDVKGSCMGLSRWLSDYDEFSDNDELWEVVTDLEDFHIEHF